MLLQAQIQLLEAWAENRKLNEKVSDLVCENNIHHLEKRMLGAIPWNCEVSSTLDHMQTTENAKHVEEVTMSENHKDQDIVIMDRYIAPPHTNFTVQKEAEIDFKNKAWISKMLEATQKLVKKYAIPCHLRDEVEAKQKNKRPPIVPKAFTSLWRNLLSFVNLPKSVPVPDSTPSIDWSQVKFKPSLPNPADFPVHSVSMDPKFYMDTVFNAGTCVQTTEKAKFYGLNPFGVKLGYKTSMGIVAVPTVPVGGYVFSLEDKKWVIFAAVTRGTASPSARGRAGGGTRGKRGGERRKKLHYHM